MTMPKGSFTYQLDDHPQFTAEQLRAEITVMLKRYMGADRDRLKSVDVATFIPANLIDQEEIRRRGLPDGPMYQIVAMLAHEGDPDRCKVMRTVVPARIRWSDIWKLASTIEMTMRNMIRVMRNEERGRSLGAVASFSDLGDTGNAGQTAH